MVVGEERRGEKGKEKREEGKREEDDGRAEGASEFIVGRITLSVVGVLV